MKTYLIITILFLCIYNFVNCKEKQSEHKPISSIPNINLICFNGNRIKDQFVSSYPKNKKYFCSIITKNIKLKSSPDEKAAEKGNLYISDEVIILHKEIYNNGAWVFAKKYLDCELKEDNNCYGWIPNNCLAYKSMFKPDLTWTGKKMEYFLGDIKYNITFISNGQYTGKWVSTYPADKGKTGKASGTVFRYENILYLKDSDLLRTDLFIELCDPKQDKGCSLKIE
ncbi:MAG: hypothetical protein V1874_17070 [Spirochaetota bacterium]